MFFLLFVERSNVNRKSLKQYVKRKGEGKQFCVNKIYELPAFFSSFFFLSFETLFFHFPFRSSAN
uniref:Uncharacterized protein n=1 Tax=Octopus bimaculoides TaxID=37653 RepID=A0A0L8IE29_OCTBM